MLFRLISLIVLTNFIICSPTKSKTLQDSPMSLWPEFDGKSSDEIRNLYSTTLRNNIDSTVNPCDDFYSYACGNWEKHNSIPNDLKIFNVRAPIELQIIKKMKEILLQPVKQGQLSAADKIKMYYSSCVDESTINKRGNQPLINFIDSLGGWPVLNDKWNENNFDLIKLLAKTSQYGHQFFLNLNVGPKWDETNKYTTYIGGVQFGISVDFSSEESYPLLTIYKDLIVSILKLLNVNPIKAEETANSLVKLEIKIAELFYTFGDGSTPTFTVKNLNELNTKYPKFNFTRYFNLVTTEEITLDETVVLSHPEFFDKMIEFLINEDKKLLANYIIWRNVMETYNQMGDQYQIVYENYIKTLTGRQKLPTREQTCVVTLLVKMSMILGAEFVENFYDKNDINLVTKITLDILNEFKETTNNLDWIDGVTKKKSINKIDAMKLLIGYHDSILDTQSMNKDYKNFNVEMNKHFENSLNMAKFLQIETLKQRKNQIDETFVPPYSPATVNAYYLGSQNEIYVPAGIIQNPIFHHTLPKSLLYGGLGTYISHEITHGFDDEGRKNDLNGNRIEWWSQQSIDKFNEKAKCFEEQYGNYTHMKFTLSGTASKSENIADNGAVRNAFKAYKKWLKTASPNDLAKETLPNISMSGEKLFFIHYANQWCELIQPGFLSNAYTNEEHAPGRFRVIGTLSNFDEFSRAYQCPIGSPMNPIKKCLLW